MDDPRLAVEGPDSAAARLSEADQNSGGRDETAHERDTAALRRDESSTLRDQVADSRDEAAERLDASDDAADRCALGIEELRERGRSGRRKAAADRAQAARDRALSTGDREHAAADRERSRGDRVHAADDRDLAGTDELTGARRRGVGFEELENEMKRARRESNSLVAAYIDVDGLKAVNDGQGHAAGDALLQGVADGFRRHMRPYDLFVRLGGDEFLCALPDVTETQARKRFAVLRGELKQSTGSSVSIGYSELRESDCADDLVQRADSALLAERMETECVR
jgi:diguanylate cyclase (GGDEF)-like protein